MGEVRGPLNVVIVAAPPCSTTATGAIGCGPGPGERPVHRGPRNNSRPALAGRSPLSSHQATRGDRRVPPRKKQPSDAGAPLATGSGNGQGEPARRRARPAASGNGQDLVIVESPSKAKTINKYLGSNVKVLASYGHVRDLPRRRQKGEEVAGVDIDAGWKPTYVVVEREEGKAKGRRSAKDILAELKREATKSARVFLATDPDREGEAIAWHIEEALGLDDATTFRVAFNEITRSAVQQAMAHPGKINMNRVQAQEARRILDRVVGYPLSNLLGRKVARGSSAGRVQSVALKLVVDREREIEAFVPKEFWKVNELLAPKGTVSLTGNPVSGVRAGLPM